MDIDLLTRWITIPVSSEYSSMNRVILSGILILLLTLGTGAAADETWPSENATYHDEMRQIITVITDELLSDLSILEVQNQKSAEELSQTGISGDAAEGILNNKVTNTPYCHSSLIISPEGVVTAAAPVRYTYLVGEDLGYQDAVIKAHDLKEPVVSDLFLLKEGFYGISFSVPVFSPDDVYLGYTDITFRPEEIIRQAVSPILEQTRYEILIMQPDGLTVYETNEEEIGKNTLTDPLYQDPAVHEAAASVAENTAGIATYPFWNRNWDQVTYREIVWDTLEYAHQEWRVALIRDLDTSVPLTSTPKTLSTDSENNSDSLETLASFVAGAVAYAKENGNDAAIVAFNNLTGEFVSGDRYIFGYDMQGTTLVLPYQPGLLGTNRMNLTDANGLMIMPGMIDMAKAGGGTMYFVYPNPVENFIPQLKIYNISPVDDTWFIGSGIFLPSFEASTDPQERQALVKRVQAAVLHANTVGKDTAIADFNDLNGTYALGGEYIFAYGYDGETLALPFQPDLIGSHRFNFTDVYGSPIIRQEIDAAKRDGGFVYVVYYNPDTGDNELKLCYVEPAGEDWLIGSGMYYTGQQLPW